MYKYLFYRCVDLFNQISITEALVTYYANDTEADKKLLMLLAALADALPPWLSNALRSA